MQIQFNYVDYDDPSVQSRKCYEVCRKFNKPVIVMEPVKGGNLVNLPDDARAVLDALHGGSPASYAIRFAAGFPGMHDGALRHEHAGSRCRTISAFMQDFKPLNETELAAIAKVQEIFRSKNLIPCTACRYCTDGCPKHIAIPDLFATMNTKQLHHDWNADYYYNVVYTTARPQGLRLRQVRQVRDRLPAAPAHPPAAGECGERVRKEGSVREIRAGIWRKETPCKIAGRLFIWLNRRGTCEIQIKLSNKFC